MVKHYDLTATTNSETVVYPGDPVFKLDIISSIDEGCVVKSCQMHLSNHTGTHIDFPSHVIKCGKTSSDYTIDDLIGNGLIIEVPNDQNSITRSFIEKQSIIENDVVFFKTRNSMLNKTGDFSSSFVYVEPEAAEALLNKKVRVVGIDYLSVDSYGAEDLPVHRILLSNDVLIVENLELSGIDPGRCKIYIMPVKVPNMDGLPARVMAEKGM